jgi:hypothetical protein
MTTVTPDSNERGFEVMLRGDSAYLPHESECWKIMKFPKLVQKQFLFIIYLLAFSNTLKSNDFWE